MSRFSDTCTLIFILAFIYVGVGRREYRSQHPLESLCVRVCVCPLATSAGRFLHLAVRSLASRLKIGTCNVYSTFNKLKTEH